MSVSGRLCLLTFVALILPSRGQTTEDTTSIFSVDQTSANTPHDLDRANPEVQPTPPVPIWDTAGVKTTESQTEAETGPETQQPTKTDTTLMVTDPGTHSEEAHAPASTTPLPRMEPSMPSRDSRREIQTPKPPGSEEEDPFYYDNATLRRRGLLVAAVLFITGIIILTSGKCRQWSGICWSRHRAYRVVNTRCLKKEETAGGSQT